MIGRQGIYENGQIELTELPQAVSDRTRNRELSNGYNK